MTITAEVKGKTADRFRAYAAEKLTRKPNAEDHYKRAKDGKPPYAPGVRIRYDGQQVAFSGDVTGSDVAIAAGETVVTTVVFYNGAVEDETVVGSVEVNAAGDIQIELVEPKDPAEIEFVDE